MKRPDKLILRAPETYGERVIDLARVAASIVDVVPVSGWHADEAGWRKTSWEYIDAKNKYTYAEMGVYHREESEQLKPDPEWHIRVWNDDNKEARYTITQVSYETQPHIKYTNGLSTDYFDLLHPAMADQQAAHLARLEGALRQNAALMNWRNAQKAPTFLGQQDAYTNLVYAYHLSGRKPQGRTRRLAFRALRVLGELRPMYARHVNDYQSYLDNDSLARVAYEMHQTPGTKSTQVEPNMHDRDETGW